MAEGERPPGRLELDTWCRTPGKIGTKQNDAVGLTGRRIGDSCRRDGGRCRPDGDDPLTHRVGNSLLIGPALAGGRIMPEPRYFSMPSVVGGIALRNEALNWTPCVRSFCHAPLA